MFIALFNLLSTASELESADGGRLPPFPVQSNSYFQKL